MHVLYAVFFFLIVRRPSRASRTATRCPYTTLFRSGQVARGAAVLRVPRAHRGGIAVLGQAGALFGGRFVDQIVRGDTGRVLERRGEVAPERRRLPPVALVPPQPAVIAAVIVLDPAQSGERERGHDGFEPRPMRAGDLLFQCREIGGRSDERRVGKEGVRTCSS